MSISSRVLFLAYKFVVQMKIFARSKWFQNKQQTNIYCDYSHISMLIHTYLNLGHAHAWLAGHVCFPAGRPRGVTLNMCSETRGNADARVMGDGTS